MTRKAVRSIRIEDELWSWVEAQAAVVGVRPTAFVRDLVAEAAAAPVSGGGMPRVEFPPVTVGTDMVFTPAEETYRSFGGGKVERAPRLGKGKVVRKDSGLPGETGKAHHHRRSTYVAETGRMGMFTTTWECDCGHRFTSTSTVSQRP